MPVSRRRFVVIGCGSIGKRHLGNLLALGQADVIACDLSEERRAEVARLHGVPTVATLEEAWKQEPDVALITLPTSLHQPVALEAARRGCALFIEKPLSHNRDGFPELLEEVSVRKLVTLVGCNMRFHPGLCKVKELLDDGAVGRVCGARVEFGYHLPDWHPSEDYRRNYSARSDLGGGVVLDAIHEIDYARWLMGEVASVQALCGHVSGLEIDSEDLAAILMRFRSGAFGEVHIDYVQRCYSRTCHIIGEEGTIRWSYTEGRTSMFSPRSKEWAHFDNPAGWEPNAMYLDEMRHFLAALKGETAPASDVRDAYRVLDIALACKEAAAARKTIDLP